MEELDINYIIDTLIDVDSKPKNVFIGGLSCYEPSFDMIEFLGEN